MTVYPNEYFEVSLEGTTKHIYAGSVLVATIESDNDTESSYYTHSDHLGGSSVITDSTGAMMQLLDYYPFGETRIDRNFAGSEFDESNKFTGQELDEDSGLYYYGARYYNPAIGRFVSMDPWEGDIKDPQTLNKYSYVMNNPLRYTDPSGKCFWDLCLIEGTTAATFIAAIVGFVAIQAIDANIPSVFDNTPPAVENEPMITPLDIVKNIINTILPADESGSEPNITVIPGTVNIPWIEQVPANTAEKGINVMMRKNNQIKIEGFILSRHAKVRMKQRNISIEDVQQTIKQGEKFNYDNKTGYYNKEKNIFVGIGKKITTVIKPKGKEKYIENLKAKKSKQ